MSLIASTQTAFLNRSHGPQVLDTIPFVRQSLQGPKEIRGSTMLRRFPHGGYFCNSLCLCLGGGSGVCAAAPVVDAVTSRRLGAGRRRQAVAGRAPRVSWALTPGDSQPPCRHVRAWGVISFFS